MAVARARLRELLNYDPDSGEFIWLQSVSNRAPKGSRAGCYTGGYVALGIDGKVYLAHRVAWFYMKGQWPEHRVDHKDGDRSNNRWVNLRAEKDRPRASNAGIILYPRRGLPYRVWLDGKYIGCYATLDEAKAARERAAK